MGLIMLDAQGNYDEEASLRANRAHLRMMEIGLAEQRGELVDAQAAAAAMTEVLSGLAGNVGVAESALADAESALADAESALADAESAVPATADGGYAAIVNLLRTT